MESVHASARLKNVSVLNSESQGAPRSGGGERVIEPSVDDMHAEMHAYCVMRCTLRVVICTVTRDDIQCVALMIYNAPR